MPMIADEYLDVATDILDITADVRIGAHLAPIDLDATIGLHVGAMEDDYDYRALGDDVTAQVLRWWPAAKAHQRAILGVAGLLQSEKALLELLWNVTGPLAGAYLMRKGRAPDNIFASVESDYHHIINALDLPNIQALRDPRVVHAVLDHDESLQRYCRLLHDQYQRAVEGLGELHPETFATAQQLVRQRVEQAQAIVAAEQAREAGRKRRRVRQVRKALRRMSASRPVFWNIPPHRAMCIFLITWKCVTKPARHWAGHVLFFPMRQCSTKSSRWRCMSAIVKQNVVLSQD
jgi:hypothetical protein